MICLLTDKSYRVQSDVILSRICSYNTDMWCRYNFHVQLVILNPVSDSSIQSYHSKPAISWIIIIQGICYLVCGMSNMHFKLPPPTSSHAMLRNLKLSPLIFNAALPSFLSLVPRVAAASLVALVCRCGHSQADCQLSLEGGSRPGKRENFNCEILLQWTCWFIIYWVMIVKTSFKYDLKCVSDDLLHWNGILNNSINKQINPQLCLLWSHCKSRLMPVSSRWLIGQNCILGSVIKCS